MLGQFNFRRGRRPEAGPFEQNLLQGIEDFRIGMSEDERPPTSDKIEIAFSIDVVELGTESLLDKKRSSPHLFKGADRAVDSPRDQILRRLPHLLTTTDRFLGFIRKCLQFDYPLTLTAVPAAFSFPWVAVLAFS